MLDAIDEAERTDGQSSATAETEISTLDTFADEANDKPERRRKLLPWAIGASSILAVAGILAFMGPKPVREGDSTRTSASKQPAPSIRSEERRVEKEWRSRWTA